MVSLGSTTITADPQLCTSVISGTKNSRKLAISQTRKDFINFMVPVSSWEVHLRVNYTLVRNIVIQSEFIVVSIERKLLKFISKMQVIEEQCVKSDNAVTKCQMLLFTRTCDDVACMNVIFNHPGEALAILTLTSN
jgi:hypothetical protein